MERLDVRTTPPVPVVGGRKRKRTHILANPGKNIRTSIEGAKRCVDRYHKIGTETKNGSLQMLILYTDKFRTIQWYGSELLKNAVEESDLCEVIRTSTDWGNAEILESAPNAQEVSCKLPDPMVDGTPFKDMVGSHLKLFLPRLLHAALGRPPTYTKQDSKPPCWPNDIPYVNPVSRKAFLVAKAKYDVESEGKDERMNMFEKAYPTLPDILKRVVRHIYAYYGVRDRLGEEEEEISREELLEEHVEISGNFSGRPFPVEDDVVDSETALGFSFARAHCDYDGDEEADTLAFTTGEILYITSKIDGAWYKGQSLATKKIGKFPCVYVTCVILPAKSNGKSKIFIAHDRFLGQNDDDLSFLEGDVIIGIHPIDDRYWEGQVGGRCGRFPMQAVIELTAPVESQSSLMSSRMSDLLAPASAHVLQNDNRTSSPIIANGEENQNPYPAPSARLVSYSSSGSVSSNYGSKYCGSVQNDEASSPEGSLSVTTPPASDIDYPKLISEVTSGIALSDDVINEFCRLVKLSYPNVQGLHPPAVQLCAGQTGSVATVQIHLVEDHWLVSACRGTVVCIFDSLSSRANSRIDRSLEFRRQLAAQYFHLQNVDEEVQVQYFILPRQKGGVDCGAYALAYVSAIVLDLAPEDMILDQSKLRGHLAHILSTGTVSVFPHSKRSGAESITRLLSVHCCYRRIAGAKWISCTNCFLWFHIRCLSGSTKTTAEAAYRLGEAGAFRCHVC